MERPDGQLYVPSPDSAAAATSKKSLSNAGDFLEISKEAHSEKLKEAHKKGINHLQAGRAMDRPVLGQIFGWTLRNLRWVLHIID